MIDQGQLSWVDIRFFGPLPLFFFFLNPFLLDLLEGVLHHEQVVREYFVVVILASLGSENADHTQIDGVIRLTR